jgi:hypothetical protein
MERPGGLCGLCDGAEGEEQAQCLVGSSVRSPRPLSNQTSPPWKTTQTPLFCWTLLGWSGLSKTKSELKADSWEGVGLNLFA